MRLLQAAYERTRKLLLKHKDDLEMASSSSPAPFLPVLLRDPPRARAHRSTVGGGRRNYEKGSGRICRQSSDGGPGSRQVALALQEYETLTGEELKHVLAGTLEKEI